MKRQSLPAFLTLLVLSLMPIAAGAIVGVSNALAAPAAPDETDRPRALLQVAAEPPRVVFGDAKPSPAGTPEVGSYPRYLETQQVLIKSRGVLEAALRSGPRETALRQLAAIKNRKNPVGWLEQNLQVTNPKNTQLIQVELRAGSDASADDQAAIINAVVGSYVEKVVVDEQRKLEDRRGLLKRHGERCSEVLRQRRAELESIQLKLRSADGLLEPEKQALSRLLYDLLKQRVQLNLDRAEAETLLNRRQSASNAAIEPVRKEINAIEERIAVLTARGNALDKELEKLRERLRPQSHTLDLELAKQEIVELEQVSRAVNAEIERLNSESNAPPRIRVIEYASVPGKS
jgi:hypothetical protein